MLARASEQPLLGLSTLGPPLTGWTESSLGRSRLGVWREAGDSQGEGQRAIVQVDQAAHDVPRCPRLPGEEALHVHGSPAACPLCPLGCVSTTAQGRLAASTGDLSPCPFPAAPESLTAAQWLLPSCGDGHGAGGPGPHLAVIRRGHIPLAHPVAVVGIGVVCVSNSLLGRKVREVQGQWAGAGQSPPASTSDPHGSREGG